MCEAEASSDVDVISVTLGEAAHSSVKPQANSLISTNVTMEITAESLEHLMESKVVKEKRAELEKKLEALRKKHDKEKIRAQPHKSVSDMDKSKSKFYMSHKLVKRLSSKNIDMALGVQPQESSECSECEGDAARHGGLPRSQSERLLAVSKEHVTQERELQEKYHDAIYSLVEKLMRTSQSNQLKMLRVLLERETADVMRKLQATRREEVKALSKIHKDKDEMVRIKREVASAMVEKGVHERVRLTQIYEKKRENLERQHEQVRMNFEEERTQIRANILREYEGKYAKVEVDLTPASSSSDLPVA